VKAVRVFVCERESVCERLRKRERQRERDDVCACVVLREKKIGRERETEREGKSV